MFETAQRLVDKHRERATAVAERLAPDALRRLLLYVIDTVLEQPAEPVAEPATARDPRSLPVLAKDVLS